MIEIIINLMLGGIVVLGLYIIFVIIDLFYLSYKYKKEFNILGYETFCDVCQPVVICRASWATSITFIIIVIFFW